ncbi:unnamed protein product [Candida verbasci]|uniref:Cell wall synthesis protein KRE9 n=1 Tax=Candida verbasci TaxID=1227364 RepID=A0A9W4TXH9_9ASCO|nr:unnamed protein product [Candida verbasci]
MKFSFTFLILLIINLIKADVDITSPKSGDSFSGSSGKASFQVSWKDDSDSDDQKSISNVQTYTISLCTGENSQIQCWPTPLVDKRQISGSEPSVDIELDQSDYPNGYYYIQIYSEFSGSAYTIHYSQRFRLTDMSGSNVVNKQTTTATFSMSVTGAQPGDQAVGFASASVDSASFTVPYTLQTGRTRYAPMQMQPGSKVTATTWTRKFPTSSVSYYSTKMKSPNIQSTITPGWSYTAESAVNYATIAPYPTNWYAASERVSQATISGATKRKRRWLDD